MGKNKLPNKRWPRVWSEDVTDGKYGFPTFLAETRQEFRRARQAVDDSCSALMTISLMVDAFVRSLPYLQSELEELIDDHNNSTLCIMFGKDPNLGVRAIDDAFPVALGNWRQTGPVLEVKIGEGEWRLMPAEQARRLVTAYLGAVRELHEER